MPKVIKNISTKVIQEDPVTHKKKQIADSIKIELDNRLDPDTNIDLMFSGRFVDYQERFTKVFGFSNGGERTAVMNIIQKITDYDELNQKYIIYEGWNNTLYIKNVQTQEEIIEKLSPNTINQVKDIIQWIYAQEKLMSYTEA